MQSVIPFEQHKMKIKSKHFLTIGELSSEEILFLLNEAIELKKIQKSGRSGSVLNGKVLGMIFEKASTRTRVSFEVGMLQLGGHAIFLSSKDIQLGRGETIEDTAKVLSRYVDGLMIRTFEHEIIETFAEHSSVPVINGLTNMHHPTQVMADLLTIYEHKGKLTGLKMCFVGDGNNNMCHSLIEGAAKVGMNISVATPNGYEPNKTIVNKAKIDAKKWGSTIEIDSNPVKMMKNADIVVTDVFASMGQEKENHQRLIDFEAYQINENLCKYANDNFIFLHCLPAHRGEEVSAAIIDGTHSVVFDEAENRLHAQKAILKVLMGGSSQKE
ncbi:ornithine carbamoyltransferase [Heyndrickxia sporothermodurans]|uniref:Ornithine carbamoyltransferase n=1 Tax=Heyndrickxia sporothermodurans TaxID=46224 RepID=A0AB37HAQ3_9BACI|nr:ornithine carbamoyltransferase [Heyndrickxia sporothermodurans]MBL5771336.1 ornithine carbamoyltransferase [Heyndrickxia sporothermodurans]MBL5775051.1 ornithine carbamoyltransferase [Heyndrickxia sporothermodurans]MBL5792470.1 ornithine carbamoyltransferase [Heyndrickxia sporothermodurans]MBL5796379.1 ornithine carbamoyltransferase [Heyndrickxia sporothermodurans]MBL5807343.1 ornithine carbamoyltransferase [Heyndrickxia sporothermodurans]